MTEASPLHAPLGFRTFVVLTAALMGLNALAIDIMLPGLPALGLDYGLEDPNRAQTVITAYLVGFGAAQFVVGILADRFGRKPVLIAGLACYTLAAFACLVAPSFETLLVARVVQGMASAAPRVVSTALVRDCYSGRRMAQVISLSMMIFMAVPVLAPSIGQLILLVAPWPAVFAVLAVYALLMLWFCAARLPETLAPEKRRPIRLSFVAEAMASVFGNLQTVGYMLAAGIFFGAMFGFVNSAQQVLGEVYNLGPWFPAVFALVAGSISISSFLNAGLVERLGMRFLSHLAVAAYIVLAAIMWLFARDLALVPFLLLLTPMFLMIGLTFANFNALAMEPQGHVAGVAASMTGAVTVLMGAGIGFVIGQAFDGTVLPMARGFLISGMATLVMIALTERGRLFSRSAADA
ncbi:multidrug effflux MFS transporter [Roseobacter sp. HKCCA0434]|uniref:multidrug effflux MFS transporter n=1 Tax=Roseobacter sp. HKCCA0434 TaxID=3079297 RepID=UPI002905D36A|nr:multidrug effflux MFS transporter [Roseobacter sp. HKCCA0434]